MNQTPRRAQEDKASIPFQSQYKNSMIHGNFLTLQRRKKEKKTRTEEGIRGDGNWWRGGVACPPLSLNPSNSLD